MFLHVNSLHILCMLYTIIFIDMHANMSDADVEMKTSDPKEQNSQLYLYFITLCAYAQQG